MLLTAVVNGHNCVTIRCRTATDGNASCRVAARCVRQRTTTQCVNAAIEINLLDYNVAVRECTAHAVLNLAFLALRAYGWKPVFSVYWVYYRNVYHHTMHVGQQTACR